MIRSSYIIIFLLILSSCARVNVLNVEADLVAVTNEYSHENAIDSIVQPYSEELAEEMNEVIATAKQDFNKGRPDGALNNWATDALLNHQSKFSKGKNVLCLLNVGGLRNSLSEGEISVGDIFKLMPFDNEVVWVEMPMTSLKEVESYLIERNGEPISGVEFSNSKINFNSPNIDASTFWILTSDYLMNGGDDMEFFEKRLQDKFAGILLRDVFIDESKKQGVLIYNDEKRFDFE